MEGGLTTQSWAHDIICWSVMIKLSCHSLTYLPIHMISDHIHILLLLKKTLIFIENTLWGKQSDAALISRGEQ